MHKQESRETAVVQHTLVCPIYQDLYKNALGESSTFKDRISFLQDRFTVLFSNLTNTHHRKRMEAVAIKLFCPKLNDQVNHKALHIIIVYNTKWALMQTY